MCTSVLPAPVCGLDEFGEQVPVGMPTGHLDSNLPVLVHQFGIVIPADTPCNDNTTRTYPLASDPDSAFRILGCPPPSNNGIHDHRYQYIIDHTHDVLHAAAPSPHLTDIAPGGSLTSHLEASNSYKACHITETGQGYMVALPHHVHHDVSSSTYHPWTFHVTTPLLAIEILRRSFVKYESRDAIARNFIERGIPFSTRIAISSTLYTRLPKSSPSNLGMNMEIPVKPEGWNGAPSIDDLVDHEHKLLEFVHNSPSRTRVALLHGGIVNRLIRLILSYEDYLGDLMYEKAVNSVLNGPSGESGHISAFEFGYDRYCDDTGLTVDEVNMICGAYRVEGEPHLRFLWPPTDLPYPSQEGYWSSLDEEWFYNRLDAFQEGTAKALTLSEWLDEVSLNDVKLCRQYRSRLEAMGREWLECYAKEQMQAASWNWKEETNVEEEEEEEELKVRYEYDYDNCFSQTKENTEQISNFEEGGKIAQIAQIDMDSDGSDETKCDDLEFHHHQPPPTTTTTTTKVSHPPSSLSESQTQEVSVVNWELEEGEIPEDDANILSPMSSIMEIELHYL